MKILVTAKRVIDPYVKIKVKADGTGVEKDQVKMAMNPFDEIALEEAIRMKEQGKASEIVLVSIMNDAELDIVRHGLALGADRAICINLTTPYCGYDAAQILAKVAAREKPDLVLMGKQAIDDDSNQVPQMLATIVNWGVVTYASKINLNDTNSSVEVNGDLSLIEEDSVYDLISHAKSPISESSITIKKKRKGKKRVICF